MTTLGTFPAGPSDTELLALNTSWVGLQLGTWSDGECPISSFVVEYCRAGAGDWLLVSNNVVPHSGQVILSLRHLLSSKNLRFVFQIFLIQHQI